MKTQGKLHKQEPNLNLAGPLAWRTPINYASYRALSPHPGKNNQDEEHFTAPYGTGHSVSFLWFSVLTPKTIKVCINEL